LLAIIQVSARSAAVSLALTSRAQEYEFFFEMKFGKKPKLTKKTTYTVNL
jgi:hypothetical protein